MLQSAHNIKSSIADQEQSDQRPIIPVVCIRFNGSSLLINSLEWWFPKAIEVKPREVRRYSMVESDQVHSFYAKR